MTDRCRTTRQACAVAILAVFIAAPATVLRAQEPAGRSPANGSPIVLAIHGGGGVRPRSEMTPALESEYRAALTEALRRGHAVLRNGGSGVEAVEAAIRVMEDSPLFNAGKGASYNRDGYHELDAAIMDGRTLAAGAVAAVQRVKNPISLARAVMEKSPHVLITGEGALEFARAQQLEIVAPHYFFTEHKWESLQRRLQQQTPFGKSAKPDSGTRTAPPTRPPHDATDYGAYGTVGAVALDRAGNLAAGTSTGGREGKLPGRVGDSPIIGAGTYANNATLAVSSTGLGEYVLKLVATKEMSDLMEFRGLSLEDATSAVVRKISAMGGGIGVVAVDRKGNVAMPFADDGMYRGFVRADGKVVVQIYREP
jgi:beta-aspartyl-peptidase (threonine type)